MLLPVLVLLLLLLNFYPVSRRTVQRGRWGCHTHHNSLIQLSSAHHMFAVVFQHSDATCLEENNTFLHSSRQIEAAVDQHVRGNAINPTRVEHCTFLSNVQPVWRNGEVPDVVASLVFGSIYIGGDIVVMSWSC